MAKKIVVDFLLDGKFYESAIVQDGRLRLPETPRASGKIFDGWYLDGKKFDPAARLKRDCELQGFLHTTVAARPSPVVKSSEMTGERFCALYADYFPPRKFSAARKQIEALSPESAARLGTLKLEKPRERKAFEATDLLWLFLTWIGVIILVGKYAKNPEIAVTARRNNMKQLNELLLRLQEDERSKTAQPAEENSICEEEGAASEASATDFFESEEAEPAVTVVPFFALFEGEILRLHFEEGAAVSRGDTVMTMFAMKMDTPIAAHETGTIRYYAQPGMQVGKGMPIFGIEI